MTTPNEARPEWEPTAWRYEYRGHGGRGTKLLERRAEAPKGGWVNYLEQPLYGPAVHTEMLRAQEEAQVLREHLLDMKNALWKATGDDRECVREYITSQGGDPDAIDAAMQQGERNGI